MSLYADYLTERTNDKIIETPYGFVTYRFLPERGACYIVDIFVCEAERKKGGASWLADMVTTEAKAQGLTHLIGTVMPSAKGSTASLKVLLAYGFSLESSGQDCIIFRKDI